MLRRPVSSSRILSVGWSDNILEIEFRDGAVYQYYDVTKAEYGAFIRSSSLGHSLSFLDKLHSYRRIN